MCQQHYFNSRCPVCAGPAFVRIEYLGELVECGRCTAEFIANQEAERALATPRFGSTVLGRTREQALDSRIAFR